MVEKYDPDTISARTGSCCCPLEKFTPVGARQKTPSKYWLCSCSSRQSGYDINGPTPYDVARSRPTQFMSTNCPGSLTPRSERTRT